MERKELSTNLEYGIIFINLFVFLIAPYLPNVVYDSFVETYVGAILLLLLVLYSIMYGYLVTVSTFTAVASLFAESHARKASKVKGAAHLPDPQSATTINGVNSKTTLLNPDKIDEVIAPVQKLVPKETHPETHTPDDDHAEKTVTFTVKDDDNVFKPVDASIDEKEPLPTISISKDVANIYEKTAHLDKMDE